MKSFNTAGICIPEAHYMADTSATITQIISQYVSPGKYFTIDRPRQCGKTTTLYLLEKRLKSRNIVLSISFESADELFASLYHLATGFIRKTARALRLQGLSKQICTNWQRPVSKDFPLDDLGQRITELCTDCRQNIILMIDEADKSSDNQIFLSFLGLLREKYLDQMKGRDKTFHSVILAGVYDVKNLKLKLHPDTEPKYNSPWNIAIDFNLNLFFSPDAIASMLREYEQDWHMGIDIPWISHALYDYTSGYPFLISRLCQIMAQTAPNGWSRDGFQRAVRELLKTPNTLFDDMSKKLSEYPELKEMIVSILFQGKKYSYESENHRIHIGKMFGFLKDEQGIVSISNRIFEMKLYNLLISENETDSRIFTAADMEKNQFIKDGTLHMELVIQKFCEYFEEIYADADDRFIEDNGRRIFLIFLKPIINGSGNYYIESRTRNLKRTDIIIDYKGTQNIIELKIWHGEEYNRRGEEQLLEYMDYYHLKKGYMLSFNFNKNKQTGIRRMMFQDRLLIEAVV